jgi:DNA-binding HxlR family transcriptional regulator
MDTDANTAHNLADIAVAAERARRVLDGISDKWTVQVIVALADGTRRFGQLRKQLAGISQKVLTETLRKLQEHKLVTRKVHAAVPPMVEYTLTPLGFTLLDLLKMIGDWSESYMRALEEMSDSS